MAFLRFRDDGGEFAEFKFKITVPYGVEWFTIRDTTSELIFVKREDKTEGFRGEELSRSRS